MDCKWSTSVKAAAAQLSRVSALQTALCWFFKGSLPAELAARSASSGLKASERLFMLLLECCMLLLESVAGANVEDADHKEPAGEKQSERAGVRACHVELARIPAR